MATLQLMPATTTINGTTYATAQLILTPVSPQRKHSKTILPKQEPVIPSIPDTKCEREPLLKLEYARQRGGQVSKKAQNHPRPQAVTRRNTRERKRVQAVNQGFITLAKHVPPHLRSKKMSKVDTLKAAILYIQDLQETLDDVTSPSSASDNESLSCSPTSVGSSIPVSPHYPQSSSPYYPQSTSPYYPQCTSPSHPITAHTTQAPTQESDSSLQLSTSPVSVDSHHCYPQKSMTSQNIGMSSQYIDITSQNQSSHCVQPYYPQSTQCYDSYGNVPTPMAGAFHIDYSRPIYDENSNMCPSPSSSFNSPDSGMFHNDQISPEAEQELLEFVSWLY